MDLSGLSEKEIRRLAAETPDLAGLIEACAADGRAGVQGLARTLERRIAATARETARLERNLKLERQWLARRFTSIGGVDEVGRGPLAGPVVAACVVLPFDHPLAGVNDSKQLSPARREALDAAIRQVAQGIGIAAVEADEIDRLNIYRASQLAMRRAIELCGPARPDCLLIDAMRLPEVDLPQLAVVHGDERCYTIAAASIVAKVHRDGLMTALDARYPGYGFAANKGYGTQEHLAGLERLGPSALHRRSFSPVAAYVLPSCRVFLELIGRASSAESLRMAGLRIRAGSSHLTPAELTTLREAYRERLAKLGLTVDKTTRSSY